MNTAYTLLQENAVQSKDSLLLNSPTLAAVLETQIAKLPRDLRLANNTAPVLDKPNVSRLSSLLADNPCLSLVNSSQCRPLIGQFSFHEDFPSCLTSASHQQA